MRPSFERFPLALGVTITRTYAHLMAHFILAFKRSQPGRSHPGPWKSANAGISFDIEAQIEVPDGFEPPEWFDPLNTIWWTVGLLRLHLSHVVRVPVIAARSFLEISTDPELSELSVLEVNPSHLFPSPLEPPLIASSDLEWLARHWLSGGRLFREHANFANAFVAFDQSTWSTTHGLGLVRLWGAFELLFATSRHQKTRQLASRISAFLEPAGETRAALANDVVRLYDSRSDAAHGSPANQDDAFFESHALLRRVIVAVIEKDHVLSVSELERLSLPLGDRPH